MAFKPGHKKLGGRKMGTPNKLTDALSACLEGDFNPFARMVEIAKSHHREAGTMTRELAQYLAPKKRSVEHSGQIESKPSVLVLFDGRKVVFSNNPIKKDNGE